ncbi:hypothetical protein J437_LFUL013387 [Ladona fulva]|uniref:PiggyBac transposable element-derived protein domain-containing protein n=1 Tax=Ladona fulva TaxID=123851 RepID=A0A8K0KHC6_LADFU|nr:hypothetical protein J437_LFUL013387 [Ladona fulva]
MSEVINLSRELTIDESIVLWCWHLVIRQYISKKHHKYRMKLYVLAEPNGLVQKIHLYGGSKDEEVGGREPNYTIPCGFELTLPFIVNFRYEKLPPTVDLFLFKQQAANCQILSNFYQWQHHCLFKMGALRLTDARSTDTSVDRLLV